MSGGAFDYKDKSLKYEIFGFDENCNNRFGDLEISELVFDVLDLIHDFDYYECGDTSEDTWLKQKKAFKEKWLWPEEEERVRRIIDNSIDKVKEELYRTFG